MLKRLLFGSLIIACSFASDLSGREIMQKVSDRPDGDTRKMITKMVLINKRGKTRERELLSYSKDYGKNSKSVLKFLKPADVAGTCFLSWDYDDPNKDDDKWLYLPALKNVRRISGSSKNDYFMGSDFTYNDMGSRSVTQDRHQLLREEELSGHDCWVIESIPTDKNDSYAKRILWIKKEAYLAVKVEYYDKTGELSKILTVQPQLISGFWTASKMQMNNLAENHQTIIEISEIQYDLGFDESYLQVANMQKIR